MNENNDPSLACWALFLGRSYLKFNARGSIRFQYMFRITALPEQATVWRVKIKITKSYLIAAMVGPFKVGKGDSYKDKE